MTQHVDDILKARTDDNSIENELVSTKFEMSDCKALKYFVSMKFVISSISQEARVGKQLENLELSKTTP